MNCILPLSYMTKAIVINTVMYNNMLDRRGRYQRRGEKGQSKPNGQTLKEPSKFSIAVQKLRLSKPTPAETLASGHSIFPSSNQRRHQGSKSVLCGEKVWLCKCVNKFVCSFK